MTGDRLTPEIWRAVSPSDLDEFRRLCTEYAQSLDFDLCFQGFQEEMAGLPGPYAEPDGIILLARVGSDLAGCVALKPLNSASVCELKRLWVRPEVRRLGIGRMLLSQVIEFARHRHYRLMRLDTVRSMTAAASLYRSVGFRESDPYTHNPLEEAAYYELNLLI